MKQQEWVALSLRGVKHKVEGLTKPAMGVGSLLIFFTRPGFMELNNLAKNTKENTENEHK